MEFLLDTLNLEAIKKWHYILPLAGVTSNPTIAKKEGDIHFFQRIRDVRKIIGREASLHVQVVAKDYQGILDDAAKIRQETDDDIYIKVPVTPDGLAAIKTLKTEGYNITATAIYTSMQGLLAISAGADYLAPYFNRMENLDIDATQVIKELAQAIERTGSSSKILAASFKNASQVTKALSQGAQSITAGPDIFESVFAMPSIAKAVNDFADDWKASQYSEHI
ncbi:TPA: fructose-6-phosphate aldolase [Streptococcus agalactiae]|uniref:fructose-6-phosphate aldolase n=1 Tax=Streptococcus agalactiae TaxID=1311 RepID=UPI0005E40355|nr:fructose-6-phosphate aldolase [Streptococcus agalactiae]MCY7250561.1 fructose-6-phosphate aldolase [Streptococcus agalactiae]TQC13552.1 fructose-6-phosphate aldolase [Streptococcus agalactiae]TQC16781.1 fructose-6-phosphate aldolase [Streptococcus agalactiae]TQC17776.1 fructose-6-phosphate aldolase [Streptococcus agalactiae]TQC20573.1 fructose-6-phosphate aldolase [Streptococcus agalactiae]